MVRKVSLARRLKAAVGEVRTGETGHHAYQQQGEGDGDSQENQGDESDNSDHSDQGGCHCVFLFPNEQIRLKSFSRETRAEMPKAAETPHRIGARGSFKVPETCPLAMVLKP